jgi:UDP-GlcNAc:undecaprenyl-phosphate/decaprenyl-phosphate GlcNAc-1-phosphate transferase
VVGQADSDRRRAYVVASYRDTREDMAPEATTAFAFLTLALALSAAAVAVLSRCAPALGLVDVPGGRKAHARAVPLVGGIAIFVAFLATAALAGISHSAAWFLLALSLVIAVGLWDDVTDIRPRLKLLIEVAASAVMIWGAEVELRSVGDLLGWRPIGLWIFAIPLTIFATVGVMNSFNMIDGLDGLGGSLALAALAWYAAVAWYSGLPLQFDIALILCGAVGGFLVFNLRLPWKGEARAFLGDAGSLMIGFALGWLAIDLTQGAGRTLPPIAALWIVLVPLADCVSLMARRVRAGKSPFDGDRHHIHHYLVARGFTSNQAVALLAGISVLFGAAGFAGWRLDVPEWILFWPFFFGFFAYHAWIQSAWRELEEPAWQASAASALEEPEEVRVPG